MNDLLARARTTAPCRRDLVALSRDLEGFDPALRRALADRDDRAFAHLLFAGLHAGERVDASVLVRGAALLPDAEWLATAAGHVDGDAGAALVGAVRDRGLGWEREPTALLVAELWCRRARAERSPGLLAEARIRGRRHLTQEGEDAVVALHGLLDDPDFTALIEGLNTPEVKDAARHLTSRLVERMTSGVLSGLPERERKSTRARGPVRRAVGKVGRNDPCPCGSGRKYKACHEAADRERNADASDVEGLTFAELSADLERHLDEKRLQALRGHELARLDPARVPPAVQGAWIDLLGQWGEHDAALAAVRSWWVADDPARDDQLRLVAEHAARGERRDVVLAAIELRGTDRDLLLEARLLAAEPAERLPMLERAAAEQLDAAGVDLGFALLATGCPALGVHVARAELVLRGRDEESDQLYAALVEARDQLLAPPWDPIDEVSYRLERGVAPEIDQELTSARTRMNQGEAALQATQEALERLRAELEARERTPEVPLAEEPRIEAPANRPVVEDPAVRELRERMEHLKSELKDRHRERNALRRELEEARERVAELERAPADEEGEEGEEDDEDEVGGLDVSVAARLRVPVFPDDFAERLEKVPEATARAALMRVGELCAGFDVAFREVRPLRGFEGTWRVKVGRSYRLLFRPLERTLEVIDLLHRQDLEKRLFRLRRGGE